jgi:LPS sulfotransferase NodH
VKSLGVWKHAVIRRLWPLQGEALRTEACHRTGLSDFGDPPLEPALSVLLNSLEHEADLRPLGRFLIRSHLRELLETRLRLTEAWSQAEDFHNAPIRRPVFITGMPRSGSTFLHELLAADPDNRAPRVWEVMFPIPAPDPNQSRDPRSRKAAARLWWFRHLAPQADSVHPLRASTPQECVAIHSYSLLSEEFLATCHVPSYEAFLHSADLKPAYLWQRRFIQHLQAGDPRRRWVLKSPDHVYGLDHLFAVFPDAVIVQTHRDPLKVLRSSIQLIQVLHGVFARGVDADRIAEREARVLAEAIERFTRFRDSHPELAGRFIDLRYSELVSDPLAAIRRIYERLEIPLSQVAAQRMRHLAANRSRYPKRLATPTLTQLGLDVLVETRRFNPYCFRFGIGAQETVPHE